jgi:hypothetical protein
MVVGSAMASQPRGAGPQRTISFAGRVWDVKSRAESVGPGPNRFSASTRSVWVDRNGYLHLKVNYSGGKWRCAEISSQASLGYGRYSFSLGSDVSSLDPNVVLGLFTWDDDPAYNDREIDLEFSRWSRPSAPAASEFVVEPSYVAGHVQPVTLKPGTRSEQRFSWSAGRVAFASSNGSPASWSYSGNGVPPPGGEKVHLNLWLNKGLPPANGRPVEVVIRSFSFTPAP